MTSFELSEQQAQEAPLPQSLVGMGFNFSIPEEKLRETIAAWGSYINRLSKESGRDPQLKEYLFLALLRRGIAYSTLGEWDAAITDFQRVIDERADAEMTRAARMLLGGIYTELCRDREAIECWSAVLSEYEQASRKETKQHAEQLLRLYLYRGMLYGRQNQYQEAIADCDRAQKYAPDNAELYSVRGISYGYLGDLDRALSECLRAVELAQQASCYNRLGEVYFMRREYQQSLAAFDRANELDPNDGAIQLNRSKALFYLMMSFLDERESPQGVEADQALDGTGEELEATAADEASV
jgi:tetratricopeptide (TPR) repeat protein